MKNFLSYNSKYNVYNMLIAPTIFILLFGYYIDSIIRAGVIIANVIWNVAKRLSGIVPEVLSMSMEFINKLLRSPIHAFPDENAKLYPNITQIIDTTQATAKCCIKTDTTFLEFTRPA